MPRRLASRRSSLIKRSSAGGRAGSPRRSWKGKFGRGGGWRGWEVEVGRSVGAGCSQLRTEESLSSSCAISSSRLTRLLFSFFLFALPRLQNALFASCVKLKTGQFEKDKGGESSITRGCFKAKKKKRKNEPEKSSSLRAAK